MSTHEPVDTDDCNTCTVGSLAKWSRV